MYNKLPVVSVGAVAITNTGLPMLSVAVIEITVMGVVKVLPIPVPPASVVTTVIVAL
jgi:hypothetical protein